jgi:uncharacterized protein YegJ (DUF2314 family)
MDDFGRMLGEWRMESDTPDKIVSVPSDDERMLAAINEAHQSLKQFLEAFFAPKQNQESFLLNVAFEDHDQREHIWLADLDLMSTPPTGVVANEPGIRTLRFMERVPFDASQISDWMYYEDKCLVGGFTTRVLRPESRTN